MKFSIIKLNHKSKSARHFLIGLLTIFVASSIFIFTYYLTGNRSKTENPTPSKAASVTKKVLVLDFNPILEAQGGKTIRQYYGMNDPVALENQYITDVRNASGSFLNYSIVQRLANIDVYPKKENGFQYTDSTYMAEVSSTTHGTNAQAKIDYLKLFTDYDVCGKVNRGEIDEVWLWGGPWFGYVETVMAGPGAWFTNSDPITNSSCNRKVLVMGFAYDRGSTEMLEDLGHAIEGTMGHFYNEDPRFSSGTYTTPWGKFASSDKITPGKAGCGWMHLTPNSSQQYEYGNTRFVTSSCEDWVNYPNLTGATQSLNCTKWNCDNYQFKKYWLSHLPKAAGTTNGFYNNWWQYLTLDVSQSGITPVVTSAPPSINYCPTGAVTRDQMAVFLLKIKHGSTYTPPAVGTTTGFADVPVTYWDAAWIKQLAAEGITGGCGGSNYCPTTTVTRDQMAVFLLRVEHGNSYTPPPVGTTTGFADVPITYWAAAWIKQLAAEGITGGCGGGNYCPTGSVTRDQMAVFLLKIKHGSGYTPPSATGAVFADVPASYWSGSWIEQLYKEGITGGCGAATKTTSIQEVLITPTPTTSQTSSGQLLLNAGFEADDNANGQPDNWSSGSNFTRNSNVKHGGSFAGRHLSTANAGYSITQTIKNLTANTNYTYSGWTNIPSTSDSFSYKIQLVWRDSSGNNLRTDTLQTFTAPTGGWAQTLSSKTSPSGAVTVAVRMVISSLNATIFVDDFSFTK